MGRRPGSRITVPTKLELLDAIDRTDAKLTDFFSQWGTSIPDIVRTELREIANELFALLIRARRRR